MQQPRWLTAVLTEIMPIGTFVTLAIVSWHYDNELMLNAILIGPGGFAGCARTDENADSNVSQCGGFCRRLVALPSQLDAIDSHRCGRLADRARSRAKQKIESG